MVGHLLGSVPPAVAGGSLLLVVLAVLAQLSGAVAWVPIVRRTLGSSGIVGGRRRRS